MTRKGLGLVLTVMTWNLENFQRPPTGQSTTDYDHKLAHIVDVIAAADADLVGVQEVLANAGDQSPVVFDDLRAALATKTNQAWTGAISDQPDPRGIRVGWLSPHQLSDTVGVAAYPAGVPATTVDDDGTTINASKRGALAVTYTRTDGLTVDVLTAHFKSKLLTFPPRRPGGQSRFGTDDEGKRARYGLYALGQRAAEAAIVRAWATAALGDNGTKRNVLVCGDLNDTPEAATTQILLGPPGSQLGTGGFDRPDNGDNNRLWNLAPAMPAGDPDTATPAGNWSRINNGVKEGLPA